MQFTTQGIILARTNYGEADRILTFLTKDHGKVKAIAKSVRKSKSKLAGGIELFSVSDLTVIVGRGEIDTLISTRLVRYYEEIVKDIERTKLAYEFLRVINKSTEDVPEPAYFRLLKQALEALNNSDINQELIQLWFSAQLLRLAGHTPNLRTDTAGAKLQADKSYNFNLDKMCLEPAGRGRLSTGHIKFLRLLFSDNLPQALARVSGQEKIISSLQPLMQSILKTYGRSR